MDIEKTAEAWSNGVTRLRQSLESLLDDYGIRRGLGLFLLALIAFGTWIWIYNDDKSEARWLHMFPAVILVGSLLLLADRDRQFSKFKEMGRKVFGQLSLWEPNEEDRRRVAEVLAIVKFLELQNKDKYDFASFFQHLEGLIKSGNEVVTIRGELQNCLASPTKFDPPYLKQYVQSLLGITYLIESQNSAQGLAAYDHLMESQSVLSRDYPNAQVSVILNARAIASALLAQDTTDLAKATARLIPAVIDFAGAARMATGAPFADYRFRVNYAEWCVRAYRVWRGLSPIDRGVFEQDLIECFRQIGRPEFYRLLNEATTRDNAILLLFESACRALHEAKELCNNNKRELGERRPIVHMISFYVAVAVHQHEATVAPLEQLIADYRDELLKGDAAFDNFAQLMQEWEGSMVPSRIVDRVMALPDIYEWLIDWDSLHDRWAKRIAEVGLEPNKLGGTRIPIQNVSDIPDLDGVKAK